MDRKVSSVVKSTEHSHRGPGLSSQYPPEGLRPPLTLVTGRMRPPPGLRGHCTMWFTCTHAGKRPTHINKSKIKVETRSRLSEKGRVGWSGLNFAPHLVFIFEFANGRNKSHGKDFLGPKMGLDNLGGIGFLSKSARCQRQALVVLLANGDDGEPPQARQTFCVFVPSLVFRV